MDLLTHTHTHTHTHTNIAYVYKAYCHSFCYTFTFTFTANVFLFWSKHFISIFSFDEQGMQPCSFYLQNGHCKFGRTCKFDHPVGTIRYSPSASSLTDMPATPYMIGSSLSSLAPSFSYSDLRPEFISVSKFDPHSSRMPSSGNTSSSSVGLIFSQTGSS